MNSALAHRLDPALDGARIQAVQQPDDMTIVLETHRSGMGAAAWVLSVDAETARFVRAFRAPQRRGSAPPVFCQWLRTRLEGGQVTGLEMREGQVAELGVARADAVYWLVLELNRRDSNLLLLDGERRLLIALRHPTLPGRRLTPGDPYVLPPKLHRWPSRGAQAIALAERLPAPDEASARVLEHRWSVHAQGVVLDARRTPARRWMRREVKKLQRRLTSLEADRAAAAEAERWRHWGELLQIHRHQVRPGMASVAVPDVFAPGQPTVTIPLDAQATPGENIEQLFRRYRKRRDSAPHVELRVLETCTALDGWSDALARLEAVDSTRAMAALADELPPGGAAVAALLRGTPAPKAKPETDSTGPMRRLSADGYTLLVGRSKEENDRVTFRLGRGRDWWLHAQGIPGSHVIVVNPTGAALPPRTLREAAWLAAHYSQGRSQGLLDVDYAQRKHVRKVKGGEPGQVTYSQSKTVLVNLDDAEAKQVLERTLEEG